MGGQQFRQQPEAEQQNAGYRAQRLSGAFGDPMIAQIMNSLRGLMGGPNVPGQMFQGGGFERGQGPSGSPVVADPAVAALLEILRGQNPNLAHESNRQPDTGTSPIIEPVPANAPPNTSTVPTANLPSTGAPAQPDLVPTWLTAMLEGGGEFNMGGPQGPQVSVNQEAGAPGTPNVA